ncbi:unnamed protein product [Aphis gossypii]|uniref:Uncharacterized protein n=1 Tax=Aphis gossypii TaxID=80765 RepID=A0A9P0J5V6_APHGO|nr:unnamed protein product [Aphis gossypii]
MFIIPNKQSIVITSVTMRILYYKNNSDFTADVAVFALTCDPPDLSVVFDTIFRRSCPHLATAAPVSRLLRRFPRFCLFKKPEPARGTDYIEICGGGKTNRLAQIGRPTRSLLLYVSREYKRPVLFSHP